MGFISYICILKVINMKKKYTEEDIRKAFQAGHERGVFDGNNNYFDAPLDEDEYIESLNPKPIQEKIIPVTYGMIKATCGWNKFCDVTGGNHYEIKEFGHPSDSEIYHVTKKQYEELF